MIRAILTRLHRYGGLALALFLASSGLTGSLIVFYAELDRALNPDLFVAQTAGARLRPSALAVRVERQLPGATVTLLSLPPPGRTAELWVVPTGKALAYNQVFADPVSGTVKGKRLWGEAGVTRAALMPMLYLFHYSLQLPGVIGIFLMGIVGCLWTLDCFIAFALTLPRARPFWRKWRPAWRIKSGAGSYRFNFDLHRASGLWLWGLLLILATSGVALNLPDQVFRPVVKLFATLSPTLHDIRPPKPRSAPALLSFDDALRLGRAKVRGPYVPRWLFREDEHAIIGVGYGGSGDRGLDGFGLSYRYFDDRSGAEVLRQEAGKGRLADIYAGMQYQLHSGRILGWPGRILICLSGLAVTILSLTGVTIWLKKRRVKTLTLRRRAVP